MKRYIRLATLFVLLFAATWVTTACGTLEVGVYYTATPLPATTSTTQMVPTTTPTATNQQATRVVPLMATPTPTPVPGSAGLRIAFVSEGDVWLWDARDGARQLTRMGDVGHGSVKLSDDGERVAFTRGYSLWAIDADGINERTLIDEAGVAALPPADPGVQFYKYDWVPGTHIVAFNTVLRQDFGTNPTDDLHLVDADTLANTTLLAPGEGGHFYYSPDGSRIAIVRSGTIDLVDADGQNRRKNVFTYTPSQPQAEDRYYARVDWAADGSALGVAIPPVEPYAQPAQLTTVWRIAADGTPARLVANIAAVSMAPMGTVRFSSDLAYVAYLRAEEVASLDPADLAITTIDDRLPGYGETTIYASKVWRFGAWAPGARRFSFLSVTQSDAQPILAQIGQLGQGPVAIDGSEGMAVLNVEWIDAGHTLSLAKALDSEIWHILLGEAGGANIPVISIPELPGSDVPPYDFATIGQDVSAAPSPTPLPTPLPEPSTLRVAFVQDGNAWLWTEKGEPSALTQGGGVTRVKISDDAQLVAFERAGELWVTNSHVGSAIGGERRLVSTDDLESMARLSNAEFPLLLYHFEWVPGTHTLLWNTTLDAPIGLMLRDDINWVHAETGEQHALLPPGEGGEFTFSPDGQRIAVVGGGRIQLCDVGDTGRRGVQDCREAFNYTPVATASEFVFYPRPAWAADSGSLRVAIPPADPHAQPPQPASVWSIPVDTTPASLLSNVVVYAYDAIAFSPDMRYIAYLEQATDASPGEAKGGLAIADMESGEPAAYFAQAYGLNGWSPDARHVAFLAYPESPRALIGRLDGSVLDTSGETDASTIDLSWVDAQRYLLTEMTPDSRALVLGGLDGTRTTIMTVGGRQFPSYDFTRVRGE